MVGLDFQTKPTQLNIFKQEKQKYKQEKQIIEQ
jgi:hypothetical protein